jgi:ferric-dicitrate binding protein FerR (iron transport regulator)
MSKPSDKPRGGADPFAQLFAHASPRQAPPAEATQEVRAALFEEWNTLTRKRVVVRRWTAMAAAASVLLIAAAVLLQIRPDATAPAQAIAQVARVQGDVFLLHPDRDPAAQSLGADMAVNAGDIVTTRGGQVALELASGGSLRLAANSRISFESAAAVELLAGAVYFDSYAQGRESEPLSVRTPFGVVRDIGTQFAVRLEDTSLALSVREGRVILNHPDREHSASAGERLIVAGPGSVAREPITAYGEEWDWVEAIAPGFDMDGRPVMDLLNWAARETGRELRFSDPASRALAAATILHGSLELTPMETLSAALATTDLRFEARRHELLIERR